MEETTRRRSRLTALAGLVALGALHAGQPALAGQTSGPDVTVINLTDVSNHGGFAGIHAYSIGTTSCNVGTQPVSWCDFSGCGGGMTSADHPVIAQNIYKLMNGRFSQIGMSWLKHGFLSTNSTNSQCIPSHPACTQPPFGGQQLGVGCTDTYGGGLNGSRPLGMRSEVNATRGTFPFPYTQMSFSGPDEWAQVDENDLNAALNPGARYFAEGQYVTADDAQAGNGLNNASYAEVSVGAGPNYGMSFLGGTVREKSAIEAWPVIDPTVVLKNVDFPGLITERYHLAMKVTQIDVSHWHYEFAIHNMNSRSNVGRFSVDFPNGTQITGAGFRAINHHSGEPYSTAPWTSSVNATTGTVTWFTESAATNPNANALRWGTLYNFWFDADSNAAPLAQLVSFTPRPMGPATMTLRMDRPSARARGVGSTP